jgi:NitT/TauT family transport system ATP-binding protein
VTRAFHGRAAVEIRKLMQAYLLATWRDSGATVLMVTHDIGEAPTLADRVVLISGSPGHVSEAIDLATPRPRDLADPDLRGLSRQLEAYLEAEIARGEFSAEELGAMAGFTGDPASSRD